MSQRWGGRETRARADVQVVRGIHAAQQVIHRDLEGERQFDERLGVRDSLATFPFGIGRLLQTGAGRELLLGEALGLAKTA